MAKWGKVDFKQLEKLQNDMKKLEGASQQNFLEKCAKNLAARLLGRVINRTPVGEYVSSAKGASSDAKPGMEGGTLRRGWTSQTHEEAVQSSGSEIKVAEFVKKMVVQKNGDLYQIEIINPVEYAAYVEYGHRTRSHDGWVPGRFMMTISAKQLEAIAPNIVEKMLLKELKRCFNV